MTNDYYVYIYYRLDTNEPFYVGKGKGDRWKRLDREHNKHFMRIINKISIAVVIEKVNLTEDEAFYWEEEIIKQLVFEYGFSIDIPNNRSNDHYCHLVNKTWGGEGASGHNSWENMTKEEKNERSEKMSKNNPKYWKNKHHSEETKRKLSENNARYWEGKHHTKETKKKISEANKGKLIGENNPNYNKPRSQEIKNKISKTKKESGIHKGKNNPMYGKHGKDNKNSKSVICVTTKRIFYSIKEASKYYKCDGASIVHCCQGFRIKKGKKVRVKSAGKLPDGTPLVWRKLVWNHNKIYRINKYMR